MKTLIKTNFNKAAHKYNEHSQIQKKSSEFLFKIAKKHIDEKNINSILDIGSGTGQTSLTFMKYYKDKNYTLCDISENMIKESRKSIQNANYIVCDAESYEFKNQYDLAISNLTMQWIGNLENFLAKMLNHSNVFCFSTLVNTSFSEYKSIFTNRSLPPPTFKYYDTKTLKKIVEKIGNVISFHIKSYKESFDNILSAAKHFKNIGASTSSTSGLNYVPILFSHRSPLILNYDIAFIVIKRKH